MRNKVCPIVGFVHEEGRDWNAACREDCALYDESIDECILQKIAASLDILARRLAG